MRSSWRWRTGGIWVTSAGLAIYDPSTAPQDALDAARVRELIAQRIHCCRRSLASGRCAVGLSHPYWVDDEHFDLGYASWGAALPQPGDRAQLAEQTARIFGRPLDRARPLWELYVKMPDGRG